MREQMNRAGALIGCIVEDLDDDRRVLASVLGPEIHSGQLSLDRDLGFEDRLVAGLKANFPIGLGALEKMQLTTTCGHIVNMEYPIEYGDQLFQNHDQILGYLKTVASLNQLGTSMGNL